ncbi:MAG: HEPN domain-containing protein [Deltaproteobacteria bacterium]|nr:HEPN domain-containing protein [Deltaproteobacteria bacterium]
MNVPETNYAAWLAKAENDFLNIENNLKAARIPWDTVCFHSQQAAEKLLKAFLVYQSQPPTRTHDLVALVARCVGIKADFQVLEEDCRKLTVYAVGSRYPNDLFTPTKEDALEMVGAAQRVRKLVLHSLTGLPPGETQR